MKISPARIAAQDALIEIERGAHSSAVLAEAAERLGAADRGLCYEIVLGVLRRRMLLDRWIDALTAGRRIDQEVRAILQAALYQIHFLDRVPAHAAVNDAVNLTSRAKKTSAKGFVNAVLRRFQNGVPEIEFADALDRLATESSHPRWLVERWVSRFGEEAARELVESDNTAPVGEFRWTLRTTDAVKRALSDQDAPNRAEFLRELAANGKIYFQDRGSQLVAGSLSLRPGERFLDVCAAPGGKTTLAALVCPQAWFVAGDMPESRVAALAANIRRQGASFVNVVRFDAARPLPFPDESFDAVLVDAPCSGTGTIRHNPEIRYRLRESDLDGFALKQLAMLANASKMVRKGGRLIYSTCSLEREENEEVAHAFLAQTPEFSSAIPELPERFRTADGFARTSPARDGIDGFFVAAFAKR